MPQRRNAPSSQNTFLDTIATRFDGIHSNFVLGNAQANGWPIVYCSDGFCELTGFARAHVMARGSGCRFLYGAETAEAEIAKISGALEEKRELKTEIQLYRKSGTLFWCLLDIVPIKNEKGDVVLFLVSHKDITKEKNKSEDDKNRDGDTTSKGSSDDSSSNDDDDLEENHEGLPDNYNYGRRRSRAVLYHISGQLNKQNKAKTKLQQLNRLASQMPEYKVQEVRKSRFIIVHYGIFKIGWDWLILLCTFYIAILVPFNAAFRKTGRFKDFMYIDAAVEVLFAIDIFLNFRTTFLNKSGQVVYEPRLIALYYIRGWFLLDLLAAIPFDLLYAFSVETGGSIGKMAKMVHLLKLARLLRLARLLQKMERYSQYSMLVLALLMCMFALSAHWLACIWYAIGKAELDENNQHWTASWLYELSERLDKVIYNSTNVPDMMTSYITALYFTCSSLTSVGFGNVSANTNVEKIFSVCAMLVGAIAHAVVFGNVTTIIQRMYARRAIFHTKTKDLKDFFRIHHFPKPLKHRMSDYFQAMWSINNGIDVRQILNDFPEEMRGEIGLHLHGEILSLPIFQLAPPGCLKSVALQTDRLVCGPGEFILRKGDAINCIYYVCSGSMEVLKEEQVVAILGKGDIFGCDVDFDDPVAISGCDVRSLAYCELLCIQMKGLIDTLLIYPDYAETFTTELPNDLTYNLREGHEDVSDDESSTAAPVITLPSISEDEEEEDEEKVNNNKEHMPFPRDASLLRRRTTAMSQGHLLEDEEEEGKGTPSQSSPLLTQLAGGRGEQPSMTSNDWLASRGRLPNGHIAAALGLRLTKHQNKLKQWINKARKNREEANLAATTPSPVPTPNLLSPPTPVAPRPKSSPISASLALRRTQTNGAAQRLAHRRGMRGDKLRNCRTLPTLNSVSTERSIEQVMVHTLQMELEGTRDTVIGLERRLDDLHEDLSSISRNVDSLLRLVSQSPNPMYLSSHSLQPSYYNQSPSHHGSNLYGQPSFYFSQSTVGDARELSSGQSNSPAPDNWPGQLHQQQQQQGLGGAFSRNASNNEQQQQQQQQFLSPFQSTAASRNSSGTPSHVTSPRFIFNPVATASSSSSSNTPTPFIASNNNTASTNNRRSFSPASIASQNSSGVNSKTHQNNIYNTADNATAAATNFAPNLTSPLAQTAFPAHHHHNLNTNAPTSSCCDNNNDNNIPDSPYHHQLIGDRKFSHESLSAKSSTDNLHDKFLPGSTNCLVHDPHSAFLASTTSTSTVIPLDECQKDNFIKPVSHVTGDRASSASPTSFCSRATPSPPALRGKSPPRPSNLSPLLPIRDRHYSFGSNSSNCGSGNLINDHLKYGHNVNNANKTNNRNSCSSIGSSSIRPHRISRSHSDNIDCNSLHVPKPCASASSSSMSSVNSATVHAPFTPDYYHLTQLEPCDAALGHCSKTTRRSRDEDSLTLGLTPTVDESEATTVSSTTSQAFSTPVSTTSSSISPPSSSNMTQMIASGSLILDPSCKDCKDGSLPFEYAECLKQQNTPEDNYSNEKSKSRESIPLIPSPPKNSGKNDDACFPQSKSSRTGSNNNLLPLTTDTKSHTGSIYNNNNTDNIMTSQLDPSCDVKIRSSPAQNKDKNDHKKNPSNRLSSPSLHRLSARNLMMNGVEPDFPRSKSTSALQAKKSPTGIVESDVRAIGSDNRGHASPIEAMRPAAISPVVAPLSQTESLSEDSIVDAAEESNTNCTRV